MSAGRVRSENARVSYALRMIRFYGDGEDVAFGYAPEGHSGAGWYVWSESYPDEGSGFVGRDMRLVTVLRAILDEEVSP